jgi:hypothetical protein
VSADSPQVVGVPCGCGSPDCVDRYAEVVPEPDAVCRCGRPAVTTFMTERGPVPYCGIADGGADGLGDDWQAYERAEAVWLDDTVWRMHLRYSRALQAMGEVAVLLRELGRQTQPTAPDAEQAAESLTAALQRVVGELDRIDQYGWAVTDPPPAYCRTCQAKVGLYGGGPDAWQHSRFVDSDEPVPEGMAPGKRLELFDPGHAPDVAYGPHVREPWTDPDLDSPAQPGAVS